jgi:hypothetical protein
MKIFEGKSPNERNKIIAAGVLGLMAFVALFFAFGRGMLSGGTTSAKVTASATPKTAASPGNRNSGDFQMPTESQQNFDYGTTEVVYDPSLAGAPDPGRNIFAFYEPPPPCPTCPTPTPKPVYVPTPTPTPTPPYQVTAWNPQSVYAGSRQFRLEIAGIGFTPDAKIYFSQSMLATTFVSDQRIVADVPANMISGEGDRQIIIQSLDGTKYSLPVMLRVQPQPKPQFQYIGAKLTARANNDTAYFMEEGRQTPTAARLNDIVGGRFRLVSISSQETIFQDVNLGFKHPVALYRPAPGTSTSAPAGRGFPNREVYVPYNPNSNTNVPMSIPGIPDNIPRYAPPGSNPANTDQRQQRDRRRTRDDDDDDDDDGDGKP